MRPVMPPNCRRMSFLRFAASDLPMQGKMVSQVTIATKATVATEVQLLAVRASVY